MFWDNPRLKEHESEIPSAYGSLYKNVSTANAQKKYVQKTIDR